VLKPGTFLEKEEIAAFFRVIKSPRDRAAFRLLQGYGLRSGEIGLLQRSDWNARDGILRIRRLKNSIDQSYRLMPADANSLRAWIRIRGNHAGPLFPSQKVRAGGLGIARTHIFRLMQQYCEAAGLPREKASPRALRNACGVHLRSEGGTADMIRERLGYRAKRSALVYFPRRRPALKYVKRRRPALKYVKRRRPALKYVKRGR
jgi:integrase/recombinase XerD